jgi:predicted ATP-grasp superfamily ATP-dependent carboligase
VRPLAPGSSTYVAPAIVIGLDCITGLQTARILAARGVPVIGLAADRSHFAARTRAARRVIHSRLSGEELITTLQRLATRLHSGAVLFPCTDTAVATLSERRSALPEAYRLLLPDAEIVSRLMNKARFQAHAEAAGLPIPRTLTVRTRADALAAADQLTFPVVLKPGLKSIEWQKHTTAKVFEARDAVELLRRYDECHAWTDELVVQEWIVGGEENLYSCNAYFDADSRPLASFVARKLRQWPVDTGTSCLGEEVRNDEVLAETVRVFADARFRGLAYLEMKRDARTGRHYIIEPNVGRPTGRSAIAEEGHVELLLTAYCDALGLPLPLQRRQRYGHARWIYLRHDLQAAGVQWRAGRLSVRDWVRSMRGSKVDAVWSLRDPLPFVLDIWQSVRKLLSRSGATTGGSLPRDGANSAEQRERAA